LIKKITLLSLSLVFLLWHGWSVLNAKVEKDMNFIKKCENITGLKIDDLYNIQELTNFNAEIVSWVVGQCSLPDSGFPSEEKKIKIKSTPTIKIKIKFASGLCGVFRLANFRNREDAILGYKDSAPPSTPYLPSLLSGEKIENALLLSKNYQYFVFTYLIYKGCVLRMTLGSNKGKLSDQDLNFIDNFVKTMKKIIDKSIK